MTPTMAAVLASGRATITAFLQIDFPSGSKHLMLGSNQVTWNGHKFLGYDPTFGHVNSGDDISEGADGQAPNTSFTVATAPDADKSILASADVQLSPCKIWLAALQLDIAKRIQAVPDPDLLFDGFIDQAVINLDASLDEIDYSVISGFDYFFEDTEGQRLSGQFHRYVWPGETGLDNVTGLTKKIYWGTSAPPNSQSSSSSIYSSSSYSGGGGSIGGLKV